MNPTRSLLTLASTLALQAAFLGGPASACNALVGPGDGARERYEHAYTVHHELGRRAEALELYRAVARDGKAPAELVLKAERALRGLTEDLAASDLAALMPPDAIAYAELTRPGDKLGALCERLGLLGELDGAPARFGVSPLLLDALLGLEGAAVAVTRVSDEGEPRSGVIVLHPGDHALLRGLLDTALSANGRAAPAIGGFATWQLEGVLVTRTERLYVASPESAQIGEVLARLAGERPSSLAQASPLREVLGPPDHSLLSVFVNGEPIRPLLARAFEQASLHDPEAAKALALFDPQSLASAVLRLDVGDGIELDVGLTLEDGHHSLAFNLLRMPGVRRETLERIPTGVAALFAASLNPPRAGGVARDDELPVTLMDFGRELFGNVVDVTLFALPEPNAGPTSPPIVLVVRSNDVERSRKLWDLVLDLAAEPGQANAAEPIELAGLAARRRVLRGAQVFSVLRGDELWIGANRAVLERSLMQRADGGSLLSDPVFGERVRALTGSETMLALAHPGRVAEALLPLSDPSDAEPMRIVAQLARQTVLALSLEHSATALRLSLRLSGVPDVGEFVQHALASEHDEQVNAR